MSPVHGVPSSSAHTVLPISSGTTPQRSANSSTSKSPCPHSRGASVPGAGRTVGSRSTRGSRTSIRRVFPVTLSVSRKFPPRDAAVQRGVGSQLGDDQRRRLMRQAGEGKDPRAPYPRRPTG
ncbi:hypothetical protein SANTM175S_10176 [Streptomyces antimycoticus]